MGLVFCDADTKKKINECLKHSVSLSPWAGDRALGIVQAHSQDIQGAGEDLQ